MRRRVVKGEVTSHDTTALPNIYAANIMAIYAMTAIQDGNHSRNVGSLVQSNSMQARRRSSVEHHAKEILSQHGLFSLPVDPVFLANRLGITVSNAKFSDESSAALIAKRGNSTRIFVEQSDPPYRKRFSIAHELGHHFLHLVNDGDILDTHTDMFREKEPTEGPISERRLREIQANWFAASLLMPEDFVKAEWERNPNVAHLAQVFNVSREAMGYRLDALDLGVPLYEP